MEKSTKNFIFWAGIILIALILILVIFGKTINEKGVHKFCANKLLSKVSSCCLDNNLFLGDSYCFGLIDTLRESNEDINRYCLDHPEDYDACKKYCEDYQPLPDDIYCEKWMEDYFK